MDCPIAAAIKPKMTKMIVTPMKNIKVIFTILLFSLKLYAKKAGSTGNMQGENKLNMPAIKAIMNDRLRK
jgi:hypothetical protein